MQSIYLPKGKVKINNAANTNCIERAHPNLKGFVQQLQRLS